jgi:hypothetical protein
MSIEAMKQALEAWQTHVYGSDIHHNAMLVAMTNIGQAIAEAEKQEPVAWRNAAIRIGEELSSVGPNGYYDMTAQQWIDWAMEQEPKGKNSLTQQEACAKCKEWEAVCNQHLRHIKKIKKQHTWVGLTDEEQQEIYDAWVRKNDGWGSFYTLIEAKLKEKNT